MRHLIWEKAFARALKRAIKKQRALRSEFEQTLKLLQQDVIAPSLETHRPKEKLAGLLACSVGFDLRIVFDFLKTEAMQESFWTAVSAIGTVGGAVGAIAALYFIYRQVKITREIAAYQFLRTEDERFRHYEMRRHRRDLAHAILLKREEIGEIVDDADYILDYFEDIGLLLKKGLVPDYFVWTMNSYWILRYWHVLERYINWVRDDRGDLTYYSEFESLYKRMLAHEKKERGIDTLDFPPKELDEFLTQELDLRLRPFRLSDLDELMEIEKTSFTEDSYSRSRFKRLYKSNPEGFWVADVLGEVVGYAVGYVSHGVGEIDSLAVHSRYRRLGLGQLLFERLIAYLTATGVTECSLEVRTSNQQAISLYRKIGFEVVDTLPGYYSDRGSAFLMKATFEPAPTQIQSQATSLRNSAHEQ